MSGWPALVTWSKGRKFRYAWRLRDIQMPIPGARRRVTNARDLTYSEGRHLREFAHEMLDAVERFVDEMIDALVDGSREVQRRRDAAA